MKVTVDVPGPLYRKLKARAAREGRTAKELILHGVEQVLKEPRRRRGGRVKLPLVPSNEPGTLYLDNARIYDALFSSPQTRLDSLSGEFDALLARLQTAKARAGMNAAFVASPKRIGKAALAAPRKRGRRGPSLSF